MWPRPSQSPCYSSSVAVSPRLCHTAFPYPVCCLPSVGLSLHLCLPLAPSHVLPGPHPCIFSFSLSIFCHSLSVFCVSFNPRALVLYVHLSYPAPVSLVSMSLSHQTLFSLFLMSLSVSVSLILTPALQLSRLCLCSLTRLPSPPTPPSLSHPHILTHPSLAVGTQGGMCQGYSKSQSGGAHIRGTQASLSLFFLRNDWLLSWEADEKSLNRDLKH